MRLVIAAGERGDALEVEAKRHGHEVVALCRTASELKAAISARPHALIVSGDSRFLAPGLLEATDAAGVRVVALVASGPERVRAAAIGLFEVVEADVDWSRIEELLVGPLGHDAAPVRRGGRVVVVWGPHGSPGRTTIAVTLAAELTAHGHRVLLVDADTHAASVAPVLGLLDEAPGFAAACRLAATNSLTDHEIERIAQQYDGGGGRFHVLTGIGRPSRWPELTADRVDATLTAARSWADVVVVDVAASLEQDEEIVSDLVGPRRNAATLTALAAADAVVAVGSSDPVGLSRFLRGHPDLLDAVGTDAVTVVMNRVRSTAVGLGAAAHVTQTVARFGGIVGPVLVPDDRVAFDAAVLRGRAITDTAPRSLARIAIRDLAAQLVPSATASRRPRRRR